MNNLIRLSKSCIDVEEKEAVSNILDSGYLGMGTEVAKFENELSEYLDCNAVLCVNSGTAALHLSLQSIGVKPGDEVLVPSITYIACFQAISATGAKPVACDINIKDGGICIEDAKNKINKNTKALMYVHYASLFSKRNAVIDLVKNSHIRLIEDAAHSFGCYYPNGKLLGEHFDIVCFSFDGIKNITCGEGGAIVSSDPKILELVKDARLLGVKNDSKARFNKRRTWDFEVEQQGWRYHMSDINAAIGRAQLRKIDLFRELRNKILRFYLSELKGNNFSFLHNSYNSNVIPHIFPILFNSSKLRDEIRIFLRDNDVESGIHYKANHLLKKYRSSGCKNAETFYRKVLTLPMHCSISKEELSKIVNHINAFFEGHQ